MHSIKGEIWTAKPKTHASINNKVSPTNAKEDQVDQCPDNYQDQHASELQNFCGSKQREAMDFLTDLKMEEFQKYQKVLPWKSQQVCLRPRAETGKDFCIL